jgi:glutathione S-transferase
MKPYNSNLTPNPRRVRIVLAEKGGSIPRVEVDLAKLEHKTPEFSALNSFQTIPILELDGGTGIAESIAIWRYIESLWPEPNLFDRARAGDDRDVAAPARIAPPAADFAGVAPHPSAHGGNGDPAGSRLGDGQPAKGVHAMAIVDEGSPTGRSSPATASPSRT